MSASQKGETHIASRVLKGIKIALCCSTCSSPAISTESSPRRPKDHLPSFEISDESAEGRENSIESVITSECIILPPNSPILNSNLLHPCVYLKNEPRPSKVIQLRHLENLRMKPQSGTSLVAPAAISGVKRENNIWMGDQKFDQLYFLPENSLRNRHRTSSEIWNPERRNWSNWDDFFEGEQKSCMDYSMNIGQSELSVTNLTGANGVEWEVSRSITSLSGPENKLSNVSTTEAIPRAGQVFLLYTSKGGIRFGWVPLNVRLETVAEWLNDGLAPHTLPISPPLDSTEGNTRRNFRKLTITEALGDQLDSSKQGINFFIGPIDGNMSFKMSICDLFMLQKTSESLITPGRHSNTAEDDPEIEILRYASEHSVWL